MRKKTCKVCRVSKLQLSLFPVRLLSSIPVPLAIPSSIPVSPPIRRSLAFPSLLSVPVPISLP
ncbi:hypothetical protein BT69DRAFT_1281053 [Atractiella rhizophila]|nr:hypothetical protein BT69DRAFT_1281053 [Atractiella rhizophila]